MFIILKIKKYGFSCSLIQTTKSTEVTIFNELNTETIKQDKNDIRKKIICFTKPRKNHIYFLIRINQLKVQLKNV